MGKGYLINCLITCLVSLALLSCEHAEVLPPNYAKGKIIAVTALCYGEQVLIELENPKGIGVSGTFSTYNNEPICTYENAVGVPYFSKIGLPDSIPQIVGTKLFFEYRELTLEEWGNGHLFEPSEPVFCTMNIIPPYSKHLIITRILSYN